MIFRAKRDGRPINPKNRRRIGPLAQPGYYPHFSTLAQQKFWDEKTRAVVLERVNSVPLIRYFQESEVEILQAICDRILPQHDRDEKHVIPIVPQIDQRLFQGIHNGYRYENMPPDGEAFRLGIQAINRMAVECYHQSFPTLGMHQQDEILQSLHDGKPVGALDMWKRMPVERFWALLVQDCVEAYYSHPWAWDEIGFGGPAYPRGYMRLEHGEPEPWEKPERRYEWEAPPEALSGEDTDVSDSDEYGGTGQGGTH